MYTTRTFLLHQGTETAPNRRKLNDGSIQHIYNISVHGTGSFALGASTSTTNNHDTTLSLNECRTAIDNNEPNVSNDNISEL
jgi:hypothetical protein